MRRAWLSVSAKCAKAKEMTLGLIELQISPPAEGWEHFRRWRYVRPRVPVGLSARLSPTPRKRRQRPLVLQCEKRREVQVLVDEDASLAHRLNQCHHHRLICNPLPYLSLFFNFLILHDSSCLPAHLDFKNSILHVSLLGH